MGAVLAMVFLLIACGGPEPTATPTPSPTPTATPLPPRLGDEHIASNLNARLDAIRKAMETVEPVWTVYAHGEDWVTPGGNTLMNDIFELLKLDNIATHDGYRELSPEVVVALEPDIIITDSVLSVISDPELSELHLVQDVGHIEHHIFVLSEGHSFSPDSPHFMDAVEELAAFVYPEVFAEDGHGHSH
ncbi:MAG: ABC transporter substrate-binding protein [Chloroflexota bacterium]|nr:ABC transporter substrate-binding protein [Chloroflexota bacterium]